MRSWLRRTVGNAPAIPGDPHLEDSRTPLFERTTRRVRLTPAGEIFLIAAGSSNSSRSPSKACVPLQAVSAAYLHSLVAAASDWHGAVDSPNCPGYDRMVESLRAQTMETQIASGSALVGTPAEVRATIARMQETYDGFDHASMQINFNTMPQDEALRSMRLFAEEVIPAFTQPAPV